MEGKKSNRSIQREVVIFEMDVSKIVATKIMAINKSSGNQWITLTTKAIGLLRWKGPCRLSMDFHLQILSLIIIRGVFNEMNFQLMTFGVPDNGIILLKVTSLLSHRLFALSRDGMK